MNLTLYRDAKVGMRIEGSPNFTITAVHNLEGKIAITYITEKYFEFYTTSFNRRDSVFTSSTLISLPKIKIKIGELI